ncbi:zinc finger BED domain-containing protein RICESLEEPER 2-like protein [Tanacetum coccineum]
MKLILADHVQLHTQISAGTCHTFCKWNLILVRPRSVAYPNLKTTEFHLLDLNLCRPHGILLALHRPKLSDLKNLLRPELAGLELMLTLIIFSLSVVELNMLMNDQIIILIILALSSSEFKLQLTCNLRIMNMDREMRQGDDTNTTTQVDGSQNQSVNGSQGDESQEQPFQEEDTNLIGNKRKLTSDVWPHFDRKVFNWFIYVPCPHTADVLANVLYESLCDWNIDRKISTVTVDNCTTNDAMITTTKKGIEPAMNEFAALLFRNEHGIDSNKEDTLTLQVYNGFVDTLSFCLLFIYVPCPHTADVLANVLYESLCDWNIDRKISTVIVDNCTTNDAMIRDLFDKLPLSSLILGGRTISYALLCPHIEKFEEAARHLDIPSSRTLALDCKTRWNSTYLMLEVAIIYKDVFRHLKQRDARYKSVPTERDWHLASNICKKLKLFYNMTLMFSGTINPMMNTFFTSICDIRYELNKWRHEEDKVIRDMAEQMILKFNKYCSNIHGFMGVATVLDPRMKLKIMKFSFPKLYHSKQRAEEEFTKLKKFVRALFIEYDQAGKANVRNHVNGVGSTSHIDESDGGFFLGYSKFIEEEEDETSCSRRA